MRAKTAETCAVNARESGGLNATRRKEGRRHKSGAGGGGAYLIINVGCGRIRTPPN